MDVEKEQDFIVGIVNHVYTFPEIVSVIEVHVSKL